MTATTPPFVIWKDSWLVGVQVIDAQHKNLVSLLNQLHHSMSAGHGKDVLGEILGSLVRYTQSHFATEEQLMQKSGYPDFIAHRREHELLTRQVVDFQRDFEAGKAGVTVDVMQFLRNWLQTHIRESDQKYAPFLQAAGVH